MRTIAQLKHDSTEIAVKSPTRPITITADELANLVTLTDFAKGSEIEGVPQLHAKLKAIVGKFADTIPIKLPATEILILTSFGG